MLTCTKQQAEKLRQLLSAYHLSVEHITKDKHIPGSFWGDSEAGLIGNSLYVRDDTPLHSALHEACHYICMDNERRSGLDTNAGGDYDEENAVCYLQILLSDHLADYNKDMMFSDMDEWGYSFRLGSSRRWFEEDAEDALAWLLENQIINANNQPSWQLRNIIQ